MNSDTKMSGIGTWVMVKSKPIYGLGMGRGLLALPVSTPYVHSPLLGGDNSAQVTSAGSCSFLWPTFSSKYDVRHNKRVQDDYLGSRPTNISRSNADMLLIL